MHLQPFQIDPYPFQIDLQSLQNELQPLLNHQQSLQINLEQFQNLLEPLPRIRIPFYKSLSIGHDYDGRFVPFFSKMNEEILVYKNITKP